MTHGEVSDRLADSGYDHATIYRNLVDLSHVGLLARTDLGVCAAPGVPRALRRREVVIRLQGRCDSCERLAG